MTITKIKFISSLIENYGGFLVDYDNGLTLNIPSDISNSDYQKLIQEIAENNLTVEGPDIIEPDYATLRQQEYPSREEQLDMMYWDKVNGTTTWEDTIQAIKDKYPKTITGGTTIGPIPAWVQEAVDAYNSNS